MNCIIRVRSRDVLLQMVDFLIAKYYIVKDQIGGDIDIKINSIVSILHTSIMAMENTIPK